MRATYKHPQVTWTKEQCEKLAKHLHRDGLGTPYPWSGYVDHLIPSTERYNGCIEIDGELYSATERTIPIVPDGFKIIDEPSWGLRIIKTTT